MLTHITRTLALLPSLMLPFALGCGGGSKSVDLAFVPADSCAVVVLHPKQLLELPDTKALPLDELRANMQRTFGFNAEQIRELIVVIDDPSGKGAKEPGMVFRFTEPMDSDKTFAEFREKAKLTELNGKKLWESTSKYSPSVYWEDKQTALVGHSDLVKRMIAAKPSDSSPLHKRLKAADGTAHLAVIFAAEAAPKVVKEGTAQLSPQIPGLDKLAEQLVAAELRVYATEPGKVQLMLHGKDESAAGALETTVQGWLAMAKTFLPGMFPPAGSPNAEAGTAKMQQQLTEGLNAIKISRSGASVNISLEKANLVKDACDAIGQAVVRSRGAARSMQAMNDLRQIGLGMMNFELSHRTLPARASFDKNGKPLLSWRVHILPYVGDEALHAKFKLDEPWDSEHNKKLVDEKPFLFNCQDGKTRYVAVTGPGTVFEGDKKAKISSIIDGMSNTVVAVQVAPEKAVIWTKPDDLEVDTASPWNGFGTVPPEGVPFAFGDGAVLRIKPTAKPELLKALFTRAGNEPVDRSELDK